MSGKSTKPNKPVNFKQNKVQLSSATGIYFWTVGTQQMDEEGNVYIDESIVSESLNADVVNDYANRGVVVILEGEVLEEYLENGFVYITSSGTSTASIRKVKEQELLLAEKDRKNAELEAKLAKLEAASATPKTKKGVENA